FGVDAADDRADIVQIGAVFRDVHPRGLGDGDEIDAVAEFGVDLEEAIVGEKAADDVFAGLGAIGSQNRVFVPVGGQAALIRACLLTVGSATDGFGVDRDRVGTYFDG